MGVFIVKSKTGGQQSPHAHFDNESMDARTISSSSLRSAAEIALYEQGTVDNWVYDSVLDAARYTFASGGSLNNTGTDQLWFDFSDTTTTNANGISWQWEQLYSVEWASASNHSLAGGFTTHKLTRLDWDTGGPIEERAIEFQTAYNDTLQAPSGPVCVPRIRAYDSTSTEPDIEIFNPIRLLVGGDRDEQPGGNSGAWTSLQLYSASDHLATDAGSGKLQPFLIHPNRWARFTVFWDWSGGSGNTFLRVKASDENTASTVIFDSVASPGNGFPLQRTVFAETGADRFRIEVNTSQATVTADVDHNIYFRNVIIWKDDEIPQGGSPSS